MSYSNYDKFRYSTPYTPDTIAHAATMAEDGGSRERFYAPTGFGEGADQKLAVYRTIAEGVGSDRAPIVRMPAFSDDNGRLEGGYFDAFLSHALNRPVLAPNGPGIDFSQWRDPEHDMSHLMTPDQYEDLMKKRSFGRTGAAVMRALIASSKYFELPEGYLVSATSQGVAIAGGAIPEGLEKGVKFEGITLGEPVNIIDRNLARLALQFTSQFAAANRYLEQNPPEIPGEKQRDWVKRVREAWPANRAYVRGLGRASFLPDLGDLSHIAESDIPTLLGRGTTSRLTPEGDFADVVTAFAAAGIDPVVELHHNHGHAYTLAVESVVKSARKIAV